MRLESVTALCKKCKSLPSRLSSFFRAYVEHWPMGLVRFATKKHVALRDLIGLRKEGEIPRLPCIVFYIPPKRIRSELITGEP